MPWIASRLRRDGIICRNRCIVLYFDFYTHIHTYVLFFLSSCANDYQRHICIYVIERVALGRRVSLVDVAVVVVAVVVAARMHLEKTTRVESSRYIYLCNCALFVRAFLHVRRLSAVSCYANNNNNNNKNKNSKT